jgi:hypothetical protein
MRIRENLDLSTRKLILIYKRNTNKIHILDMQRKLYDRLELFQFYYIILF